MGLPGSGKSTIRKDLLNNLAKKDRNNYVSIEDAFLEISKKQIDKIFRYPLNCLPARYSKALVKKLFNRNLMQYDKEVSFIAKYGKALEAFFSSTIYKEMPIKDRKVVIGSFLEAGTLYECVYNDSYKQRYVFFEEGLTQKSLMFVPTNSESIVQNGVIQKYLENIPLPDQIIYVHVSVDACVKRMKGRIDGLTQRLANLEKNQIYSFMERANKHLTYVSSWVEKNSNTKIVHITNESNYVENIKYLSEALN